MYGVGQPAPRRRGLIIIIGVIALALVLLVLFFAFYQLVLKDDSATSTPSPEATVTEQVASPTEDNAPSPTTTATSQAALATPTIPPTLVPTMTSEPTATLRPPAEVITLGVRARVNISEGLAINLRDQPTLSGSTVITQLVAGSEVDVVDGPEEADDLVWWNVNGGGENSGWVVEGFAGETWLVPIGWTDELPPLEGAAPTATATVAAPEATPTITATTTPTLPLTATPAVTPTVTPVLTPTNTPEGGIPAPTVDGQARVTTRYQFVNLRAGPGLSSEVIGQLADGSTVTILEGPEEADNLRWWRVDDGKENVGWAAERVGQEVFLVPIP